MTVQPLQDAATCQLLSLYNRLSLFMQTDTLSQMEEVILEVIIETLYSRLRPQYETLEDYEIALAHTELTTAGGILLLDHSDILEINNVYAAIYCAVGAYPELLDD